jgi:hypothetical protein
LSFALLARFGVAVRRRALPAGERIWWQKSWPRVDFSPLLRVFPLRRRCVRSASGAGKPAGALILA